MTTLAEHIIVAGAENRPLMLEKSIYDSWASRIRLFKKGKKHGRMMLDSINNGPLVYPTIVENGQTRPKKYSKLTEVQQFQDDRDVQGTNIILHDCTTCSISLLPFRQVQVNTKFLNALPPEWSKFVTDVKLAKSLYTTNYDQLYTHLSQHERHAQESPQHSVPTMHTPPKQFTPVYAAPIHHQQHHTPVNPIQQSVSPQPFISPSVTQQPQVEFPQMDSSLAVPTFQQGEDLIDCINKAMAFLSAVASRFPPSNNQLRTSSNPRNQATIQDGRVTVQQIQGRQTQSFAGTRNKGISSTSRGNYATSQPREKLMLVEAQEAGQILDEEQLAFIADPGIEEAQVAQQTIPQNSAFQTKDLDAYDSDCDDISSAKAVLMANLSSCDSDVLSEVPYSDTYLNDMINQDVQEMPYSEQTHIVDFPDNEITSDSNIIPYSQYLQESQDAGIQDTNSSAPNDLLVLSLVEQMTDHVANLDKENQTNKINAKLAAFQQENDTLKQTLSNHVKEKESLSKTLIVFKTESKEKESKYIEKDIALEKQNKEVENIIFLKGTFNTFDKTLLDEIIEVQTVFNQMEAAVDQCSVDKNIFEIQIKQLRIDNDQLLNQIMSQEIVHIVMNFVDSLDEKKSCVNDCTQSQEKNTVIRKLKDRIKSLMEKDGVENIKKDIDEIETINIELEHSSVENSDLNAQLQEKVFAITTLKNELRKLKGKNVVDTVVLKPNATIAPGMFKLDIEPISHRLKNNRDAHEVYIEKTIKNTDTLYAFVERARTKNPCEPLLESACMFAKHIQELLVYVSQTCHNSPKPSEKLVAVIPLNKDKRVRFAKPVTFILAPHALTFDIYF
ncbi:hypothetical protein Tco_0833994 [Tanacetum coccineum]